VTFVLSKLLWIVVAPGNLLLVMLIIGVVVAAWSRRRRGFGLIVVATIGFLSIAALPIGLWLAAPLEDSFPAIAVPARVDGIVVLGGSVDPGISQSRGQVALVAAAGRVTETVILARRFPDARVVISGGDASLFPAARSEAAATRDLLVDLGVAAERIVLEGNSRNTYENAAMSHAAAQPKAGETWLLVTSAMHMPRAVGCFRHAGWTIIPYPVDYHTAPKSRTISELRPGLLLADNLVLLTLAVKEWLGLAADYALGRIDALLPA
jgi:uncharacterized SAM-binding protein YcdF (DUF218 family)